MQISILKSLMLMVSVALVSCGDDFNSTAQFHGSGEQRPELKKKMSQGEVGEKFLQIAEVQEEEFQQKIDEAKLDLLVVIDNSGSMDLEQTNLATKMTPLLSHIADSDWQIAVTTTDATGDCLTRDGLIRQGELDVASRFETAIKAGTQGSANEKGILQAVRALSMEAVADTEDCAGITEKWVRPDSALAVLIVSDEDNCSESGFGSECKGEEYRNPSYLTDYLASIRQIGVNARVYGLIWEPGTVCGTGYNQGVGYDAAIKATNGTSGSICDDDYTDTLETISEDISVILESKFRLSTDADPTSLEVLVDGDEASMEYKVFGDIVSFRNPPPPGSTVMIKYRPISVEGKNRFPLSRKFEGQIMVEIGGELLEESQYTVDKKSNEVVFRKTPPKNAEIRIYYGEESMIRDSFKLEPGIREATLKITIDGVEVEDFEFDNTTGLITFGSIPPENAEIIATYAR